MGDEMNDDEFGEQVATSDDIDLKDDGIKFEVSSSALEGIANAAAHLLKNRLNERVEKMLAKRLDDLFDDAFKAAVRAKADAAIEDYLTKPRHKTNAWGDRIAGETRALSDCIPEMAKSFMDERVDSRGNRESYQSDKYPRRIDWIVGNLVRGELEKATAKAAADVTEKARMVVSQHVGRFISEQMIPAIEMEKK